ncbi:MAG: hypothetical protein ACHQFW_01265 [Chitinophagales bacterium]
MKKLFLILILGLLYPEVGFSQRYPTGKGTMRTGGGASFSLDREETFNIYKLSLTPRLGYFITDEILTGFLMNYTMTVDTDFVSAIKFTPQFKYYYKLKPSTFLIGNFEIGIDRATTFGDSKSIIDHTSVSAGPGVAYFFSRRVGFEINILYQQYLNPDDTHTSKINGTGGFVLNILTKEERKKALNQHKYELKEEDDE